MKIIKDIPKFNSIAEEAEFWDTHSFADYWDDLPAVNVQYASKSPKKEAINIRIDPVLKKNIDNLANSYSLTPSSLIRKWLTDCVREAGPYKKYGE